VTIKAKEVQVKKRNGIQRWWKETDPCQQPLPDAAAKGKIWSDTKEVFYLK